MTPYYQDSHCTIYHGDCRDIVQNLPHVLKDSGVDRFDLVLTDPPYGLGNKLEASDRVKDEWRGGFSVAPEWDGGTVDFDLLSFVLSAGKDCICWGGNYYPLPPMRGWLMWDKMQKHTSGDFELAWTNLDIPTRKFELSRVEAYCPPHATAKEHPTQKPLKLIKWCIDRAGEPQTILDPFMGSGTTLRAAKDLNRKAIGIEISERYCQIAVKRLQQEVLQF